MGTFIGGGNDNRGAASGKLPNPADLSNAVLNDILPRVPDLVAAARTVKLHLTTGPTSSVSGWRVMLNEQRRLRRFEVT